MRLVANCYIRLLYFTLLIEAATATAIDYVRFGQFRWTRGTRTGEFDFPVPTDYMDSYSEEVTFNIVQSHSHANFKLIGLCHYKHVSESICTAYIGLPYIRDPWDARPLHLWGTWGRLVPSNFVNVICFHCMVRHCFISGRAPL